MPNTLVAAEALIPYLQMQYDLPAPVECALIRRGFNDTYRVQAEQDAFVLRLYFNGKYYIQSEADFRFELDWLTFLNAEGILVAVPIRRKDGDLLGALDTDAGSRWCALFTFAPGERREDLTPEEGQALGDAVARLHVASSRFTSPYPRYHLDLQYLTEQPMRLMAEFLDAHGKGDIRRFEPRVAELERQVQHLPRAPEVYGLIHGDLHPRNFYLDTPGNPTFFDFDHGGYGWRAYDVATCMGGLSMETGSAFLDGYAAVRPLSEEERAAIPVFQQIRPLWDIGDVLAMRTAWGDSKKFGPEYADTILQTFEQIFDSAPAP